MNAGVWSGVVTAILMLAFLGGVSWAWSSRRKSEFDQAAQLPLDDDNAPEESRQ